MLRAFPFGCAAWLAGGLALIPWAATAQPSNLPLTPFRIAVVDEATGRGVPLVELKTTHHVRYLSDSGGLIAFAEPGLLGQRVFFAVHSHGYEFPKDGFGSVGVALDTRPGGSATLKLKRLNVAERRYRLTGAGCYRDTVLLGEKPPVREPLLNAQIVGQDSALAAIYQGRLHWFWGDTTPVKYPLGNFHTAGATSELPARGGLDPGAGVDFCYFTNAAGFSRAMAPLAGEGIVWLDGLLVVPDETGRERLVAHYSRMKDLGKRLEHGLVLWNDERAEFEKTRELPPAENWRCPQGHPVRVTENGREYFYSLLPDRAVRVAAELAAVLDPARYEAFTCSAPKSATAGGTNQLGRDADGRLAWSWRTDAEPMSQAAEKRLLETGALPAADARFQFRDTDTGQPVTIHGGSVNWNPFRRKWILIGVQQGGTSFLGEVWYAEAASPVGPWGPAKKIVTHDQYSFYNPVQRPFFDQAGGRVIYFEGTYAQMFSGNPAATPWYDYNQILYRLDLADPRLQAVRRD